METSSYSDFSLNLHKRGMAQRVPLSGIIETSRRCPMDCVHCYNRLPLEDREAQRQELTYEEHCHLLDEIVEAGCLWLLYSGGEIFARRDFLDIYTYAKKKGLLITLFTNGVLLTPKIADYLVAWRPFAIEITLYGRTKETYERITRSPGSFERCLRGIQLLRERNLPLKLKTMAITLNKHEIEEMKRFAREELGVEFRFDAMINPRIDSSSTPLAVRLKPEEVVGLDLEDPQRMAEWKRIMEILPSPEGSYEPGGQLYICGAGQYSFSVDPQGRLKNCLLSPQEGYSIRKGNFREGWDRFLLQERQKKTTRLTKCLPCGIKRLCGMCPVNGELEAGGPEEPVEFLCNVAHLRAQALGVYPKPHGECKYCEGLRAACPQSSALNPHNFSL